jgi:hypothetical protein
MHYYLSKLCLTLFLSSFSIPCGYGSQRDILEESEDKKASQQPAKRGREEFKPKEQAQTQSAEKPKKHAEGGTKLKKRKVEKKGSPNISIPDEEEEEDTEEIDQQEHNREATESFSSEKQIRKSAEIGTWVGDQEDGIAALQLFYKGTPISNDIVHWHEEMGQQVQKIVGVIGRDRTNFIRARVDFIYKQEETYKPTGVEIPLIFISGHSNIGAKKAVAALQEQISGLTNDPCISIDSYFDWIDLGKDNYMPIREVLSPFFKAVNVDEGGHQSDPIAPTLLGEEEISLENPKKRAFQGWLHSEEPLVFYFLGKEAKTVENINITSFRERMSTIQLPKGIVPELCILSIVSRNDCCIHCRPLVLEVMQHKEFLEKSILDSLETEPTTLKKVLLYSALDDFQIKRPKEGYITKMDLGEDETSVLFLMAGNNPGVIEEKF